ncbi:DNA polymerase III subunit epsilon [Thiomicrorhabdus immobilis]|uniref:DNA polymerase III subunit epsilon n=1 Tax=Thiomicrorhabdus immobilis TaxID=2791037 RepID=A0ABM7MEN8_9GAMM|nr:3'-5' exonuclease [Thiomicrorhabdus immobilis]BCN93896.1 DNA polymerase III subunit epsilon [Thiomicrorhabdus immobilis]
MMPSAEQQACIDQLTQSGNFQVLHKLHPLSEFNPPSTQQTHKVCIIDTETTGLDTDVCEIIELGYQIVEFDSAGHFYRVLSAQNYLNEPKGEITAEVTQVTGLTFEDVQGHTIPWEKVEAEIAEVQLCVAHNAGFDRPVLERYSDMFMDKIWGCSVAQIDWLKLAHVGSKSQEFLCWKVGQFFYGAHRALDDVQALTQLLSCQISDQKVPAFSFLLSAVRQSKSLIKATGAPFDIKDALRSRGYRWNVGERVWQTVLDDSKLQDELAWLIDNNTPNPNVIKLKATDSFSVRAR